MSEALETRPVQSSEWTMAIRDYKFDLTVYEISVGALYGTCGNWGQKVWLSDKAISDITGMTRRKASAARKTLLALGLIEDIGQHGYQPSQREYRLTLPKEMPARRMEGDEPVEHTPLSPESTPLRGDEPVEHTPCAPGAHPGESVEHTQVSPQGTQELDLDLEVDLEGITGVASPSGKTQDQNQDSGLGDTPSVPVWDDLSHDQQQGRIAELSPGVLEYVLAHGTEDRPLAPARVAYALGTDLHSAWETLTDLAGGGFTRRDFHPVQAWAGMYWPRQAA